MAEFELTVNGDPVRVDVEPDMPLLWVLRDILELTGTKFSCGEGLCGSCAVHVDGDVTRSCVIPISEVSGKSVVTIEGLSPEGTHPLQIAWNDESVPQCGYCQPGQIMTAAGLLAENPNPSDEEIESAMAGTLCRCGTYNRIRRGIQLAVEIGGAG